MDKSYFYLLNQANGDYNAMVYSQPNNPTAMNSGDKKGE